MVDNKALYPISAGVYLFTALDDARGVGRVVDAVSQVSSDPTRVSVALMKTGYTSQVIGAAKHFCLTVLAEDAPLELIHAFGYQSSEDADKFAGYEPHHDEQGTPWLAEGALSRLSCDVFDVLDVGSHLLVLGDVTEAEVLHQGVAMTYAGYRALKASPAAATNNKPASSPVEPASAPGKPAQAEAQASKEVPTPKKVAWRCTVCGYVVEMDELPDDFVCPLCGMGRDMFEKIEA